MEKNKTEEYWKKLKEAWVDNFIQDLILRFNDIESIVEIGLATGYTKKEIKNMIQNHPKNHEEDLGWSLFDSIWHKTFESVIDTSTSLSFEVDQIPLIGTLPTGRVNALAILTPEKKKYILAFELGLIPMIVGVSNYIASNLEPSTEGDSNFTIREEINSTEAEYLVNLMINYCTDNIPVSGNHLPLQNKKQRTISQGIREIIKLFVVGHEYGHVCLNHFSGETERAFNFSPELTYTICEIQNHQKEHEADQFGFLVTLVYHLNKELPYWFSAAFVGCFLKFTGYIDLGTELIYDVKPGNQSHPQVEDRIRFTEDVLFQLIPKKEQINYYALKGFNNRLLKVFEGIFFARITGLKQDGHFDFPR